MKVLPSDASTVMLLRLRDDGGIKDIEVLMVRRNRKSSFVPGYYVFPGGVVEKSDSDAGMRQFISGLDGVGESRMFDGIQNSDNVPGAWVAGIRETFEEVGILLAERRDGSPVSFQTENDRRRFCEYRKALIENKIRFAQMLAAEDLVLPLDRLHYFSRWITPEPFPLRYDVRFFVAEAPSDQVAMHDDIELTGHVWLCPAEALRRYEQGKLDMVLPQIMTLEEIKHFRTIREVIDAACKRHIPTTLTKIKRIGGKDVEVMPDGSAFENRPPFYAWPDKES